MALGFGIGIPFIRVSRGAAIDAQAQAHFDRVIADGGLVPSGLSGVNAFFTTIKTIYATADITTAISVGLDAQVLGYKLGAGAGTTAGQAAQKLYSCSGASGDVVQTTAASQPLLLVHSGENYYQGVGVASNYVTTPSSAVSNITGDIEMVAKISIYDETGEKVIIAKRAGASASYVFSLTSKLLRFRINTTTYDSNASHSFAVNEEFFAKVTRQQSSGDIKFFTSLDGVTYTQLGTTISGITVPIDTFSIPLTVGLLGDLNSFAMKGKIFRATISNTIGGAPVVDFNPNQYNAATSQTQWTSSTGEIWTINTGTATTGYKGVLVDRSIVQTDGIDDQLLSGTVSSYQYISRIVSARPYNMSNFAGFVSGTSDNHLLYNNSSTLASYNGVTLNFTGISIPNFLRVFQADFNSVSSENFSNNISVATGNTGTRSSTQIRLGVNIAAAIFGNALINTLIDTNPISTSPQRTSMYNYIRSINNL
jgi:hypothetical protein